jgi:hypothetical protein
MLIIVKADAALGIGHGLMRCPLGQRILRRIFDDYLGGF